MKHEQSQVREFVVKAGQEHPDRPTMPPVNTRIGRLRWLAEELCELANAWGIEIDMNNRGNSTGNFYATPLAPEKQQFQDPMEALTEAYDASLDLIVFAVGNGVVMGTELEPGWEEVHRSNMSKFIDGHRAPDGKWIKGPSYSPADLRPIIERQIETAEAADKFLKSQQALGL